MEVGAGLKSCQRNFAMKMKSRIQLFMFPREFPDEYYRIRVPIL